MTIVEIAAILVAVAFALVVGFLVPVLIQVRKSIAESEQLLAKMNNDLPPLIGELRAVSHNVNNLTEQARMGVEHAAVLLHAVGEVGESVQHVHDVVKGSSGSMAYRSPHSRKLTIPIGPLPISRTLPHLGVELGSDRSSASSWLALHWYQSS